MSKEKNLITTENLMPVAITPQEDVQNGIACAKALKTILDSKEKPVIFNGKRYGEYDDWQTLGRFFGVSVKTYSAEPVEIDGIKGFKSKAELIDNKTGQIIGGAEAYCMRDEKNWGVRAKYEWQGKYPNGVKVKIGEEPVPMFQLASMSQTRAGAKALKNHLSWVMVLAGVSATPAEEMTNETDVEDIKQVFEAKSEPVGEPFPDKPIKPMKSFNTTHECNGCGELIDEQVHSYSKKFWGKPLCRNCQTQFPKLK